MNFMNRHEPPTAIFYRMVMKDHVCPYDLKAKDLLRREGSEVEAK